MNNMILNSQVFVRVWVATSQLNLPKEYWTALESHRVVVDKIHLYLRCPPEWTTIQKGDCVSFVGMLGAMQEIVVDEPTERIYSSKVGHKTFLHCALKDTKSPCGVIEFLHASMQGFCFDDEDMPLSSILAEAGLPVEPDPRWGKKICDTWKGPVRTKHVLLNDGVHTVFDLISKSEKELLRTPNFGPSSLQDVKAYLQEQDLQLRQPKTAR